MTFFQEHLLWTFGLTSILCFAKVISIFMYKSFKELKTYFVSKIIYVTYLCNLAISFAHLFMYSPTFLLNLYSFPEKIIMVIIKWNDKKMPLFNNIINKLSQVKFSLPNWAQVNYTLESYFKFSFTGQLIRHKPWVGKGKREYC